MTTPDYDTDFYAWTQVQAAAIQARAWDDVDVDHVAEEIEDLWKNDEHHLTMLVLGFLELIYRPYPQEGQYYWQSAVIDHHRDMRARTVIWFHTFGERFADPSRGRPAHPPRLLPRDAPWIPADGAISQDPSAMPDTLDSDATSRRLLIGSGYVDNVAPEVWNYEVSGQQVLRHWFSYRKANRERPIIGTRRRPSPC
jgi:hypothetical protein